MNENPCKTCKNWCSCPERSRGMLCTAYIKYNPYYREDKWSERLPQVTGAPLALIVGSEIHEQQEHTPATAYQHIQNWLACWQEVLA